MKDWWNDNWQGESYALGELTGVTFSPKIPNGLPYD
jgi:hypothetical protein